MQETQVQALGREDFLEKEMTTYFLPEKSHGQRSLAGYKSMGPQRVRQDWAYTHDMPNWAFPSISLSSRISF